jgi:ribonuclease BN (tRNA processing enzyme)
VDLLIAECSLPDELGMDTHLTPSRLAALARVALPKRILITHLYPQLPRQEVISLVQRAGWDGEMLLAEDGLRLELI